MILNNTVNKKTNNCIIKSYLHQELAGLDEQHVHWEAKEERIQILYKKLVWKS